MSDILDKIADALTLADNASTDAEREAAMTMAQRFATKAQVDLAVARARAKQRHERPPEAIETRKIQVNPWSRREQRDRFVELWLRIADANDVRTLIGHNSYMVFPTGFPSDLDVVQALYSTLSVQMVAEADAALKRGENKETWTDGWGDKHSRSLVHGKVFRNGFYEGFIARVSSRLWEARRAQQAEMEEESSSTAVALRDKKAELDAHIEEDATWRRAGSWRARESSDTSYDAQDAGQRAGARARLGNEDDRAMSGAKAKKEIG